MIKTYLDDSRKDVIKNIEPFVAEQLYLLKPVKNSWQPSDLLPDLRHNNWAESVQQHRDAAQSLSDEILVVLVGNMITEEGLPTYQTLLNRLQVISDVTGADDTPWAQWTRGWTAEENRHGDILRTYLYLTGRVNMRSIEIATQQLLRNGFDPHTGQDAYKGLIYTSFQERATKISHGNVAQLARASGDVLLGKICNFVMADEARHEEAYKRFVKKIAEIDPSGCLLAFAEIMKLRIAMPGQNMSDENGENIFLQFATVAQRAGVYTICDYASIIEHLVTYWNIPQLSGLSGEAEEAQTYLCGLASHYLKLADKVARRLAHQPKVPSNWIFGR